MVNTKRLESILEEVKEKFPRTKNKKVRINIQNLGNVYMIIKPAEKSYILNIDESTIAKLKSSIILKGGFAHEWAHIENDSTLRGSTIKWANRGYRKSSIYRGYVEVNADITAILNGFGKELYYFKKFVERNAKDKKYIREEGLTPKQVKKLIPPYK